MTPIERVRARSLAQVVLGIRGCETPEEIKRAYKARVFAAHPDRGHGSNDELAEINAAYALLTGEAETHVPAAPRKRSRVPSRPSVSPRVFDIDEMSRARGERLLAETDEAEATDHVACSIRQTGRRLTYLVDSRLVKGRNRVALPAEILATPSRKTPKILSFRTAKSGKGEVTVPEDRVRSDFPGASEVRIVFGATFG